MTTTSLPVTRNTSSPGSEQLSAALSGGLAGGSPLAATGALSLQGNNTFLDDPDVRLMLRVRDGDAGAFEEIVQRYQARLLTVMEHLVDRRHLAEDLVQDVFIRVFRARERYTPTARFSTWIFTIANNVALNSKRDRARRREVQLESASSGPSPVNAFENMALAASGMMPNRQLDKQELRGVVRAALETLNERQRIAVLLNKFEHMSYAEIAQSMGMTEKAVKSLLSRARTALRDVLSPYLSRGVATQPSGEKA